MSFWKIMWLGLAAFFLISGVYDFNFFVLLLGCLFLYLGAIAK